MKDRFHEVIELPPLRERKEDIPLLVNEFLQFYSKIQKLQTPLTLKSGILDKLMRHDWPGNVREFESFIDKLTRRFDKGGELSLQDLPDRIIASIMRADEPDFYLPNLPLPIALDAYMEKVREAARQKAGSNMAEVDRLLGQKPGTEKQRQYRKKKVG